jgi:hopene-associated glycosyltransferase HpnB
MTATLVIAAISLVIWIYLIGFRGGFWRAAERDDADAPLPPTQWPDVVAIVPARDEADVIAQSLGSLLAQDYPGRFTVVLVDDQSQDGTADVARATAANATDRVTILSGPPRPPGWSGKVWAMRQGVAHVDTLATPPRYILFTDADILYEPSALRHLVARAEAGSLVLTSLMVKLRCQSFAERAFIPAFVFFFAMLYPFAWVNRREDRTAAAAGGCMLVRRGALALAGGIETIRGALIDDCALARHLKRVGPIWLGLTARVHSLRAYPELGDIRRMVARTAYDQLGYSALALTGTVVGLAITYVAPPLLLVAASGWPKILAGIAYVLMALAFWPTLRLYRLSPFWGFALPAIALAYMVFTLDSAYQHARGRGGLWKGRVQANVSGLR